MEQKNIHSSTFIHYFPLLVTFLSLAIFFVCINNLINTVISQNDIIISLLKNIKNAPSLPIVVENSVPNTDPNTADNTIYYVLGSIVSLVFIGVVCYFLFNSKPSSTGSSTRSSTPSSDGVDENPEKLTSTGSSTPSSDPEKLTKINLDLQNISQEREEILNKLNDMSEKSNGIGSINTKIEELYDYLTDPASTAENVKITEKINTLVDQQAVLNAGMKQVMSSNLGFIEGTKRVFGELTTDRHVLSTTLKELSKKQTQLEINQHDLSKTQNDIEIAHGIIRNDVDFHRQNIALLNHNAQNCSDQLLSIKESCTEIIKLIGEHSS